MRSRASIHGHALHAMLIPFPLAFLSGAFLFDVAALALGRAAFWITGTYLAAAGIAAALIAAIPGAIDARYSVPPRSTGRQRVIRHAAANLGAVALFALAWWLRPGATEPSAAVVLVEAGGVALLAVGGWMGGTLVARNQIGVDHRYAGAGKWREVRATAESDKVFVLRRPADLEVDQMMLVHAADRRIVLGRTAEGLVAFEDRCPHRGASLADGVLMCGAVQCPWHGSQFDVRTGARRAGPAETGIATHTVEERGDQLRLRLDGASA